MPSLTKPSIDQVLTNSPGTLGLDRNLGVALGDVDDLDAEIARELGPFGAVLGLGGVVLTSSAMLSSASLTKCETSPGLAPWVSTAVGPPL